MAAKHYVVALAAGTVLSGFAVGAIGTLGPSGGFPRLAGRSPWSAYTALAAAPTGSWVTTLAVSAVILTACFLAAGLAARRRAPSPPAEPAEPGDWPQEPLL